MHYLIDYYYVFIVGPFVKIPFRSDTIWTVCRILRTFNTENDPQYAIRASKTTRNILNSRAFVNTLKPKSRYLINELSFATEQNNSS